MTEHHVLSKSGGNPCTSMLFLDNTSVYCHTVCTKNTIKETRTRANIIALTPSTL